MATDYALFNSYSEPTRVRIVECAQLLLKLVEIYNEREIPISYLEENGFEYSEFASLVNKIQEEILGHLFTSIDADLNPFWDGPKNNRIQRQKTLSFNYENNIVQRLNDFLESTKGNDNVTENSLVKKIVVGPLVYDIDGGIYFNGKSIEIRPQIKSLCILFMKNNKRLIGYPEIKEEIISAKKRSSTGWPTITKYVNELHVLLKKHFKKDVIFNHVNEGYIFDSSNDSEK